MKKERIGLDFDGILTRPIPPFGILLSYFDNPRTLHFFIHLLFRMVRIQPIFLNIKLLKTFEDQVDKYKFYVISGRTNQNLVSWVLRDYWGLFEEIIARKPKSKLKPWEFKERVCKAMEIDWYFEDNYYTICYLRSKGIKAVKL